MNSNEMKYKTVDLTIYPICKKKHNEGVHAYIKRMSDDLFYVLCEECWMKATVSEIGRSKIKAAKVIPPMLRANDKLWRYMDLAKFISLLRTESLFFASPNSFQDKFEGALGELKNKDKWDNFYLSQFRASMYTAPDNCWHPVDEKYFEDQIQDLLKQLCGIHSNRYYISCWHCNEYESEAMWNLYAKNVENAVAIQTTYGKLKNQLGDYAEIDRVRYIDYSKQFADFQNPFLYKRVAFEYEHEVRAIHKEHSKDELNLHQKKVNLQELIDSIYISPLAPEWFFELVLDIIQKYGFNFEVKYSIEKNEGF